MLSPPLVFEEGGAGKQVFKKTNENTPKKKNAVTQEKRWEILFCVKKMEINEK